MTPSRPRRSAPLVAGLAVSLLGAAAWILLAPRWAPEPASLPVLGRVPPFALTTEAGETADESLFAGKASVVDFIFTSCAGICPAMSGRMAWLQEETLDRPGVRFVSVSVDPATDTPEVLAAYGRRFGAVPGRWTFLTGDRDSIYALSRQGFRLGLESEGDDAILHSQKFVLVDGAGAIRGYYDSDSTGAMDRLLDDLRRLDDGSLR